MLHIASLAPWLARQSAAASRTALGAIAAAAAGANGAVGAFGAPQAADYFPALKNASGSSVYRNISNSGSSSSDSGSNSSSGSSNNSSKPSPSSPSPQQPPSPPAASKAFVVGKLSQEELWLAGLPGRIKIWAARAHPHLKGRETAIVDEVRARFYALITRHAAGRLLTDQARRQLKLACLAAATREVLTKETGGDAAAVDEHIAQSMGSLYAPFLLGSLKGVAWFKRLLFNETPYALALGTLRDIAADMEGGCEVAVTEQAPGAKAALTVSACMFHEILAAEGAPELLRHLCCQHNAAWLDAYRGLGVASRLDQCRARGDAECVLSIEQQQQPKK